MEDEAVIGIIGGVGPMAGVKLHEKIIQLTPTNGTDQDHLHVHHISRSRCIPDRTCFLQQSHQDDALNPCHGAIDAVTSLLRSLPPCSSLILGVPCNTFHSHRIWAPFAAAVTELGPCVQLINMVDATMERLEMEHPHARALGLLCTEGTRKTELYHHQAERRGKLVVCVPEPMQSLLSQALYHESWGVKAVSSPVTQQARSIMTMCVRWLIGQGAQCIILGCTEIPLVLPATNCFEGSGVPLIDPLEALAQQMVCHARHKPSGQQQLVKTASVAAISGSLPPLPSTEVRMATIAKSRSLPSQIAA